MTSLSSAGGAPILDVTAAQSWSAVPSEEAAAPRYVGLISRAISFALDAAVINLVAVIVGVGSALVLSLLRLPKDLHPILVAIGAAAYILWSLGYFVAFWSTTGQTPGGRVLLIRAVRPDGQSLSPVRSLVRCAGVLLAAIPLGAGFLPILFGGRRRGLQDWLAGSVVVETAQPSLAQARRAKLRATRQAARRQPPAQG